MQSILHGLLQFKTTMISKILCLAVMSALYFEVGEGRNAFRLMFPEKYPEMLQSGIDPGEPLFLTPLIEKGEIKKARYLSMNHLPIDIRGYSGFFTVNKTTNSNMFFWFFPSQTHPVNAPVLLWLQGGPGGSSLFGLFVENGPLGVDANAETYHRNITWNSKYSMLYIDNPVGTGFSFTEKDSGYVTNEDEVARDLYSCLTQFFTVFSDYRKNDFYITGESYAGKYVPAISYKIHKENPTAKVKINYKGMAIGDGLCDPVTMMSKYANFMFSIGVLDENERDYFQKESDLAVAEIKAGHYMAAFKYFDRLLNGDMTPYPPYFQNVTGLNFYYNFLYSKAPAEFSYYGHFLARRDVRRAIHVGSLKYNNGDEVEKHLLNDMMQSVKDKIAVILDNYKVLIYNGQLDIIIAVPLTESWLQTVQWSGLEQYKKAPKIIWKIHPHDVDVAGYVRNVKHFCQVIVRGAGHILPYDQPERGMDMIQRFIENR